MEYKKYIFKEFSSQNALNSVTVFKILPTFEGVLFILGSTFWETEASILQLEAKVL